MSQTGGFYWYILALQDLLRATEFTGASGVYAIHYYVNGSLSVDNHRSYIILDALQAEYLHNTYNSMPNTTVQLDKIIHNAKIQWDVYNNSRAEVTSNKPIKPNKTMAIRQFEAMFMYTSALRRIVKKMAENIKVNLKIAKDILVHSYFHSIWLLRKQLRFKTRVNGQLSCWFAWEFQFQSSFTCPAKLVIRCDLHPKDLMNKH